MTGEREMELNRWRELGKIMGVILDEYASQGERAFYSNRRMILNLHKMDMIDDGQASILLAFNIKESGDGSSGLTAR